MLEITCPGSYLNLLQGKFQFSNLSAAEETGLSLTLSGTPNTGFVTLRPILFFQTDPLLCDLPTEITLEEINSQIALEYGQAMVVNVRRADNVVLRKSIEYGKCSEILNTSCLPKSSGRSRGGSIEPPFETKLFHFHGEFLEKSGKMNKQSGKSNNSNPLCKLNPLSRNPGSAPEKA